MRIIDADALKQAIEKWQNQIVKNYGEYDDFVYCLGDVLDMIEKVPTIEERKKGRWLNKGGKICCSECGRVNFCKPNFCDECGADMREEKAK